ncbi:MAG: hypothetical protein VZS44_07735 [Bacilli bacterium]|nr:hypothetical protein [Bacilli bacterium]
MSIISFLDTSGEAVLNGARVITTLNEDDYRKNELINLTEEHHLSEEEAKKQIEILINNWKQTGELGRDLHKLLISKYIGSGTSEDENERREKFVK